MSEENDNHYRSLLVSRTVYAQNTRQMHYNELICSVFKELLFLLDWSEAERPSITAPSVLEENLLCTSVPGHDYINASARSAISSLETKLRYGWDGSCASFNNSCFLHLVD